MSRLWLLKFTAVRIVWFRSFFTGHEKYTGRVQQSTNKMTNKNIVYFFFLFHGTDWNSLVCVSGTVIDSDVDCFAAVVADIVAVEPRAGY